MGFWSPFHCHAKYCQERAANKCDAVSFGQTAISTSGYQFTELQGVTSQVTVTLTRHREIWILM